MILSLAAAAFGAYMAGHWWAEKGLHWWHIEQPSEPHPERVLTPRQRQRLSAYRIDPILRSQIKENA